MKSFEKLIFATHTVHNLIDLITSVVHVLKNVVQLIEDVKVVQLDVHRVEAAEEHQLLGNVVHRISNSVLPLRLELKSGRKFHQKKEFPKNISLTFH